MRTYAVIAQAFGWSLSEIENMTIDEAKCWESLAIKALKGDGLNVQE